MKQFISKIIQLPLFGAKSLGLILLLAIGMQGQAFAQKGNQELDAALKAKLDSISKKPNTTDRKNHRSAEIVAEYYVGSLSRKMFELDEIEKQEKSKLSHNDQIIANALVKKAHEEFESYKKGWVTEYSSKGYSEKEELRLLRRDIGSVQRRIKDAKEAIIHNLNREASEAVRNGMEAMIDNYKKSLEDNPQQNGLKKTLRTPYTDHLKNKE